MLELTGTAGTLNMLGHVIGRGRKCDSLVDTPLLFIGFDRTALTCVCSSEQGGIQWSSFRNGVT
jgi:hypothetical protein